MTAASKRHSWEESRHMNQHDESRAALIPIAEADAEPVIIPARRGIAIPVSRGQSLKVINVHGSQVLDTWAFAAENVYEYMSMEHTRAINNRLVPRIGERYVSATFLPMFTVLEDTSPGVHDTLMCCCSAKSYERLNHRGYHDNCRDNFQAALSAAGKTLPFVPGPLNLFMNFPISREGTISRDPPVSRPGDYILFKAEMDLLVVMSACPQ